VLVLVLVLVCAGVRLNMLVLVCVDAGGYVAILSLKKSGHECVFGLCVCVCVALFWYATWLSQGLGKGSHNFGESVL
jgi:hypothetical protein